MNIGFVKKPLSGNRSCGDECCYWQDKEQTVLCVIDGLGHGDEAEQAAQTAKEYLQMHQNSTLTDIFYGCDKHLIHTRGVAMGIAVVDRTANTVAYAGVGNIRAMLYNSKANRFSCNYGIVGGGFKVVKSQSRTLQSGDLLILYSDGLQELIDLSHYEKTLFSNCQSVAGLLLDDWSTQKDDAVVLVYQHKTL